MKQTSRCRIAGEAMNPNERTSTNPDGVRAPFEWHVCPRHDFDTVDDPKVGCPKCNAERAARGVAIPFLTDEQVKERAAKAGLRWIDPIPDEDGEIGYPGGFDMSSLDEIRALIAGVKEADRG